MGFWYEHVARRYGALAKHTPSAFARRAASRRPWLPHSSSLTISAPAVLIYVLLECAGNHWALEAVSCVRRKSSQLLQWESRHYGDVSYIISEAADPAMSADSARQLRMADYDRGAPLVQYRMDEILTKLDVFGYSPSTTDQRWRKLRPQMGLEPN